MTVWDTNGDMVANKYRGILAAGGGYRRRHGGQQTQNFSKFGMFVRNNLYLRHYFHQYLSTIIKYRSLLTQKLKKIIDDPEP